MATTMGFQPYDMNGVHVVHILNAATPLFHKGDPVTLTAGLVGLTTSDQSVFGVAAADHSAVTTASTDLIPVYVADPSSLWIGTVATTSVAANLGLAYGLTLSAGNSSIDLTDTTTTSVRIIDFHPGDGPKTLGRVLFMWKQEVLQVA